MSSNDKDHKKSRSRSDSLGRLIRSNSGNISDSFRRLSFKKSDAENTQPQDPIILQGWLHKMKRNKKSLQLSDWNRRYFKVQSGNLSWARTSTQNPPSGVIPLLTITKLKLFEKGDQGTHSFVLACDERSMLLRGDTATEVDKWVRGLQLQMDLLRGGSAQGPPCSKNQGKSMWLKQTQEFSLTFEEKNSFSFKSKSSNSSLNSPRSSRDNHNDYKEGVGPNSSSGSHHNSRDLTPTERLANSKLLNHKNSNNNGNAAKKVQRVPSEDGSLSPFEDRRGRAGLGGSGPVKAVNLNSLSSSPTPGQDNFPKGRGQIMEIQEDSDEGEGHWQTGNVKVARNRQDKEDGDKDSLDSSRRSSAGAIPWGKAKKATQSQNDLSRPQKNHTNSSIDQEEFLELSGNHNTMPEEIELDASKCINNDPESRKPIRKPSKYSEEEPLARQVVQRSQDRSRVVSGMSEVHYSRQDNDYEQATVDRYGSESNHTKEPLHPSKQHTANHTEDNDFDMLMSSVLSSKPIKEARKGRKPTSQQRDRNRGDARHDYGHETDDRDGFNNEEHLL